MIEIPSLPIDCKYFQQLENGLRENLFPCGNRIANRAREESSWYNIPLPQTNEHPDLQLCAILSVKSMSTALNCQALIPDAWVILLVCYLVLVYQSCCFTVKVEFVLTLTPGHAQKRGRRQLDPQNVFRPHHPCITRSEFSPRCEVHKKQSNKRPETKCRMSTHGEDSHGEDWSVSCQDQCRKCWFSEALLLCRGGTGRSTLLHMK